MRNVYIVNLDSLFLPNLDMGFLSFQGLFEQKGIYVEMEKIASFFGREDIIMIFDQFKQGNVNQEAFIADMKAAIEKNFELETTAEDFFSCWQDMNNYNYNPVEIESILNFLNQYDVEFVSYSDPVAMEALSKLLAKSDYLRSISFVVNSDNSIDSIMGLPVHISYKQKTDECGLVKRIAESHPNARDIYYLVPTSDTPKELAIKEAHLTGGTPIHLTPWDGTLQHLGAIFPDYLFTPINSPRQ